jgi:D-threonate/D-erythronate kinase
MNKRKKIVVIADDFTGAAEIGGIGLRHGLKVSIETEAIDNDDVDLCVIATDTRSMDSRQAAEYISEITRKIIQFGSFLIYKKIDSVLRGNVSEELESQLSVLGKDRSVIIAANPVFNRIIKDGLYYIDDIPLNQTCFSDDSQYPLQSNDIRKILSPTNKFPVISKRPEETLPEKGLIMGDVENLDDLRKWTLKYNENTLFAGASGFFNSLLISLQLSKQKGKSYIKPFGEKALFILGSSYPKDQGLIQKMISNGHYHTNMPIEIYLNTAGSEMIFEDWATEIVFALQKHKKVIASSIHSGSTDPGIFLRIKKIMAELVKKIFDQVELDEILIEGGSTTSEILNKLKIARLIPVQELEMGVIRMHVDNFPGLCLTTKPGSYSWPENVWLRDKIDQLNKENFANIQTNE